MALLGMNSVKYLIVIMLFGDLLIETIGEANINKSNSELDREILHHDFEANDETIHHHIVKRKSKIGRGFGFGKKKPKPNKSSYPKQPGSDTYPRQPAYNPNYNPGYMSGSNMGPPPAYPGLNKQSFPGGHAPQYPQPGYGYNTGFGKNNYKTGFGGKHGGLGRSVGAAGFGALAGTALGAYGGYKLGRMVGNLGRGGYYGYYDDYGRYMKCDPPRNIKFDPETNVTYIPLEDDYDKRCHYYDRRPPSVYRDYTNSCSTMLNPINHLMNNIMQLSLTEAFYTLFTQQFMFYSLIIMFIR